MNKNSINEVAKTYQRLVEAARQSPPMPLEAPDSDEVDTYSPTGDPVGDSALRSIDELIAHNILKQINDILQQLANCEQTNNCEYLKSEYIRLTRYLQAFQGLVESAPPQNQRPSIPPAPDDYLEEPNEGNPDPRPTDLRYISPGVVNDILQQLAYCNQTGNCTQEEIDRLMRLYYEWTSWRQRYG